MGKDRIGGAGKQVKGTVKTVVGKLTGDKQLEVEGKAEKAAGKVQSGIGKAKDSVHDFMKK